MARLGQESVILTAVLANIISWLVWTLAPSLISYLLPSRPEEEEEEAADDCGAGVDLNLARTRCVSIGRPGGLEQLRLVRLREGICTVGYNVRHVSPPPYTPPFSKAPFSKAGQDNSCGDDSILPQDCVIVQNEAFSVNYADCTIRWGLYESAKKFVGWPIVPGFDIAGVVERVGGRASDEHDLQVGDRVFGCTLFGAYSSRVLVPKIQLRKIPDCIPTFVEAAAFPTVSLTALYALHLAGYFSSTHTKPGWSRTQFRNQSILIHSAAGGVGSFLVQISKILGLGPIVGVVGSSSKVEEAMSLGCDVVIDKSKEDLWPAVEKAGPPNGYSTIMDANGVSTLQQSYNHLAQSGRLVIFGFHSNLPMGKSMLSPFEWLRMAKKAASMPKFDAMDLTVSNKSILGFNLSFFAEEREVLSEMFDQILQWIEDDKLYCPHVVEMEMNNIADAHTLIQSGKSIGKIVMTTNSIPN